jgi:hypothetical protein
MAKFELPADPSDPAAIMLAFKTLHDCFDRRLGKLERRVELNRVAAVKGLKGTQDSLNEVKAAMETVREALGLTEGAKKKPIALWTPQKTFGWVVAFGGGFFVVAKILNAAGPGILTAAVAVWQSAIH